MSENIQTRLSFDLADFFDKIEHRWESHTTARRLGNALVFVFILELLLIEGKRQGWLPEFLGPYIKSTNHFYAVNFAFTMLLIFEVVELVFSMAHSVAGSVGKQFEILSLILLRSSFKEFTHFNQPINWTEVGEPMRHILTDSTGALIIFLALGVYYRLLKHQKITKSQEEQVRFVAAKKITALTMLLVYGVIGMVVVWGWITTAHTPLPFFQTFYTILIFADFLMIFISLRYSGCYHVLFRNSGFALSTVVIRVALTAPPYFSAGLGICAMIFVLGITWAYNRYVPVAATSC